MPLSSNAPFSEFGQSMILRDIEQIYLALNGAGVGSAGDGQTQDQSVAQTQETGDSGGITDLSGLATVDYVNQVANQLLDSIPAVTYPISIANGGTGQTTQQLALDTLAGGVTANRVLRGDGSHVSLGQVAKADIVNSTACSVLGRSASSAGVVGDIAASADNQIFIRESSSLGFLAAPSSPSRVLKYNGSSLLWGFNEFYATLNALNTSGSYTVSASRSVVRIIMIGGGGGGGYGNTTTTVGYMSSSSGGSPTSAVTANRFGGGGQSGGMCIFDYVLSPGDVINYTIGTAGAAGTAGNNGSNGGNTLFNINGGATIATAYGGEGGKAAGQGGFSLGNIDSITPFYALRGVAGESGDVRMVYPSATITPPTAQGGSINPFSTKGDGGTGSSGSLPSAGIAGVIYIATSIY